MTVDEIRAIPGEWHRLLRDMERLEYLRAAATSVPALATDNVKVQVSVRNRSMVIVDELVDLERDLTARLEAMSRKEHAAEELFKTVREPDRKVLNYFYCRHLTMRQIAEILFFSPRYCYKLRRRGLEAVERRESGEDEKDVQVQSDD